MKHPALWRRWRKWRRHGRFQKQQRVQNRAAGCWRCGTFRVGSNWDPMFGEHFSENFQIGTITLRCAMWDSIVFWGDLSASNPNFNVWARVFLLICKDRYFSIIPTGHTSEKLCGWAGWQVDRNREFWCQTRKYLPSGAWSKEFVPIQLWIYNKQSSLTELSKDRRFRPV